MHNVLLKLFWLGLALFSLCGCFKKGGQDFSSLEELDREGGVIAIPMAARATNLAEDYFKKSRLDRYDAVNDAILAVRLGRADAFLFDTHLIMRAVQTCPDLKMLPEMMGDSPIVAGVGRGKEAILDMINAFICQYMADGTYASMTCRWFGAKADYRMPDIESPKNPKFKIRVGTCGFLEPMNFFDSEGRLTGFDVEFAKRLSLFMDAELYLVGLPFHSLCAALDTGNLDIIISNLNDIPERHETLLLSKPYIMSKVAAMARNEGRKFKIDLKKSFERTFIREDRWKLLLRGLIITVKITFFAIALGLLLAIALFLCLDAESRLARFLGHAYVTVLKGTPALVVILLLYYVVLAGSQLQAETVAMLGLALNFAATMGGAIKSGVDAVPEGQRKAGLALGLTRMQTFKYVVLPQAMGSIRPAFRNAVIALFQTTSIVGYIAIKDLTKMSDIIRSRTFEALFPILATAIIYFTFSWLMAHGLFYLSRRNSPEERRKRLLAARKRTLMEREAKRSHD